MSIFEDCRKELNSLTSQCPKCNRRCTPEELEIHECPLDGSMCRCCNRCCRGCEDDDVQEYSKYVEF